jgi:hypothetical protein
MFMNMWQVQLSKIAFYIVCVLVGPFIMRGMGRVRFVQRTCFYILKENDLNLVIHVNSDNSHSL